MTTEMFTYEDKSEFANRYCMGSSGQIHSIIFELFNSANKWATDNPEESKDPDKEHFILWVEKIVNELRLAHTYAETDIAKLASLPLEEYKAELSNLTDREKVKLNLQYDTFWQANNIVYLINNGKLFDENACGLLGIDQLETIADMYVDSFWMQSTTLEWALINSMVYSETINFARVVNDTPKMKFLNIVGYSLWQTSKFVFKEVIALILTAIASNIVDSSQGTTYWIVFATITIIRWLNPIKVEQIKHKAKPKLLLAEMIGFYDAKIKHSKFNPRLIRELLHDLEKKGASYSHWVYHILDRRLES
ncbi:MAG: hypothetical protein Q8Q76_12910 [Methylotenera sp.]|nr:hypothetical protein [Methylotenera sp.]